MTRRSLAVLLVVATSMLVACGGGGTTAGPAGIAAPPLVTPAATPTATPTPTPTPSPTLSVSPQSVTFDIGQPVPQPQSVVLSGNGTAGAPLVVSVADPTIVGVTTVVFIQPGPPTYAINPVAHGSTTVSFTSGSASATVTATTGTCGRPDFLRPESQLVYPRPGSAGVAAGPTTLYFAIAVQSFVTTTPTVYLHLILGQHETLESSVPLQPAAPPPGAATPPPSAFVKYTYMRSDPALLRAGTAYRTQLYDDTCQPAILTGSFST